MTGSVEVRLAHAADLPEIMGIIDASLLAIGIGVVRDRIRTDEVLVAVEEGPVLGVVVFDEAHIEALAVRRARREQGIARALVEAVADAHDELTADFREELIPFYESLGFEIIARDAGRCRGIRRP